MNNTVAGAAVHLEEIGQIAITVKNLAKAKEFYRDVLGMRFLFNAGTMAFFQCGSVRLMLGLAEAGQEAVVRGVILYFKVAGIGEVCRTLEGKGAAIVQGAHVVAKMADHVLWMAFVKDIEGNLLGLMEEVRD